VGLRAAGCSPITIRNVPGPLVYGAALLATGKIDHAGHF